EGVERITSEIKKLIADMIETMHEKNGVGLAAQQIGRALQLTVLDVPEIENRPAWMEIGGKRVELKDHMPLVLINPEIKPTGEMVAGGEGCLSFPEIFAEIKRAEAVDVKATNEKGETIEFRGGGLLARAVQHEVDHLNGILFIDRMDKKTKEALQPELDELQAKTKTELQKK
ncbi:MAG TPA: peptide deformylase, partial [Verrucomicrobiae bacterium]|nr:peptide deformylase [Verrucomicrobiae bacterium]